MLNKKSFKKGLVALVTASGIGVSQLAFACGGFFCDFVPINQAAEQIVFRQEGSETTAMIKIDYVGNAEDFGWVLPVPTSPDISIGSDQIFTDLELATRPQFNLKRVGQECPRPEFSDSVSSSSASSQFSSAPTNSGVVIEKTLSVGPFDAQVVSSDDPQALANWLDQNNLDLTDDGASLLEPYIQAKSKFVVLKLKNNANSGSIQPVILKYQASEPVIPMTLTAVAAQPDMGVMVWLLGEGRGVPSNYKHVTPNYTRLNWYRGTRSAYASYQRLVTAAMNETDTGQGFATDFAGYMPNLVSSLSSTSFWTSLIEENDVMPDAEFIAVAWRQGNGPLQAVIREALPTSDMFVYNVDSLLEETFSEGMLREARIVATEAIREQVIKPLDNAIDILDDNLYLTRLYTTLSADEMTQNPAFTFNTAMGDQPRERNATLTAECVDGENHWTLKLGEGTGREDELVIDAWQDIPFGAVATEQQADWKVEITSATADPIVVAHNKFTVFQLGERPKQTSSGGATQWLWLAGLFALLGLGRALRGYSKPKSKPQN